MNFFRQLFVWWHGQTLGTRIWTLLMGKRVGRDAVGNTYYRHRQSEFHRWVIYEGLVEASKVPPEWHAWLHNMVRHAPQSKEQAKKEEGEVKVERFARSWFRSHRANLTGTKKAYLRPAAAAGSNEPIEYEPWNPEAGNPDLGNPDAENPSPEKPSLENTEKPDGITGENKNEK